jgi:hypothetical protein
MTSQLHNFRVAAVSTGAFKVKLANLKADDEALHGELIRRSVKAAHRDLFQARVTGALRQSLDAELVRSGIGERWCASHCNIAATTLIRATSKVDDHLHAESLI